MRNVTIVGAGPAGSTAAIVLARRGWAVTLIEQHAFPRDKVCGECLSALGLEVLGRLDLLAGLAALGPTSLTAATIHSRNGAPLRTPLPRPMWGVSRRVFDSYLLDAARRGGAIVRQPARCEWLRDRPGLSVRVRDLVTNQVDTLTPSIVLIADGKGGLTPPPPAPTGDFGIKAHFRNLQGPGDAIELFGAGRSYGGLAPIEDGRWNAAFSVPGDLLKAHRGDLDAAFGKLLEDNHALARRLRGAWREGDWLASPLPRFAVRPSRGNVIPIGNAAAALEPIGGEGMGLAMRSAELAAEALDAAVSSWSPQQNAELAARFRALWNPRRAACRGAAIIIGSPQLAAAAARCARTWPGAMRTALKLMGKGRETSERSSQYWAGIQPFHAAAPRRYAATPQ